MGGGDKSLRLLGGRPVLARVVDRLAPQVGPLALNANGDPARFADIALPVVPDPVAGHPGPLAGILAGLEWAAGEGERVVTVAADTPFFPHDLVARLLAAAERAGAPIALAATRDAERGVMRHPTFGVWSVALASDLRDALSRGVRKIVEWTDAHGAATEVFDGDDPFFNLNTPDDFTRGEAILA